MHLVEAAIGEIEPGGDRIGQPMRPDLRCRLCLRWLPVGRIIEAGMVEIFMEDVKLPEMLVGIGDPELRLQGIAALDPFLTLRGDAPFFEPSLQIDQRGLIGQPKPKMIQRAARLARLPLCQRQHQRRLLRSRIAPRSASPLPASLLSSKR